VCKISCLYLSVHVRTYFEAVNNIVQAGYKTLCNVEMMLTLMKILLVILIIIIHNCKCFFFVSCRFIEEITKEIEQAAKQEAGEGSSDVEEKKLQLKLQLQLNRLDQQLLQQSIQQITRYELP